MLPQQIGGTGMEHHLLPRRPAQTKAGQSTNDGINNGTNDGITRE